MKFMVLSGCAFLLTSCRLFDSHFWESTAGPEGVGQTPVDVVTAAIPGIVQQGATGNYLGAAIGAGSVIATLLGWKGYRRVKASGPGTLGILAPKKES